jgi:hypothetical protein
VAPGELQRYLAVRDVRHTKGTHAFVMWTEGVVAQGFVLRRASRAPRIS